MESALAVERENQQILFQSEDAKEGLAAYVEKRQLLSRRSEMGSRDAREAGIGVRRAFAVRVPTLRKPRRVGRPRWIASGRMPNVL